MKNKILILGIVSLVIGLDFLYLGARKITFFVLEGSATFYPAALFILLGIGLIVKSFLKRGQSDEKQETK